MFSPITKPSSGEEFPISELPNELVIEILTRLPGKQVGMCRCVCKPWRALIRSRPFSEMYRKRQRGMLLYWSEEISRDVRRLRFFHCPLRLSEEPPEEFSPLCEMELEMHRGSRKIFGVSQLVNGLLCVTEREPGSVSPISMTIHNICTGEMMRVPDQLPCVEAGSSYYLGYDPVSKVYKLLRMIVSKDDFSIIGAHVMTLRPPSRSPSTWRELDNDAAGICDLQLLDKFHLMEAITSPDAGMLCWISVSELNCGVLYFDLNREMFRHVDYPDEKMTIGAVTRCKDSLALWLLDLRDYSRGITCYVHENNDLGKNWSDPTQHLVELVMKEFKESKYIESSDRFSFSTSGEFLVRNPDHSWLAYPYSRQHTTQERDEYDVFIVGKLPDGAPDLHVFSPPFCSHRCYKGPYGCGLSRFVEGNNIYLSVDDVFGGATAIM